MKLLFGLENMPLTCMCLDRHTDSSQLPVWADATRTDVPTDLRPPQEWRWSLRMGGHRLECLSYREQSSTKSIQTSDAPPCVDIRIYIISICISSFKIYVIHMRDIKFSEGIYIYREKEKGRQRQIETETEEAAKSYMADFQSLSI